MVIYRITEPEYGRARYLFRDMPDHLAAQAVLAGKAQGDVYVDDLNQTRSAMACARYRFHLVGLPDNPAFLQGLRELLMEQIIPAWRDKGEEGFLLYYQPPRWADRIAEMLSGVTLIPQRHEYWVLRGLRHDWRHVLPEGYAIRTVDRQLLEGGALLGRDALEEEMCSERVSVEDFLAHSFGLVAVKGRELAGWCLSEYNLGQRCEVGIATLPGHRRQGIATALASAFVEEALRRGISHIGWHARAGNIPSLATARNVGFVRVMSYQTCFVLVRAGQVEKA